MAEPTPEIDPLTQIRVEAGNPSPEHAAAAIAVVAGMLREGGAVEEDSGIDEWTRSVRSARESINDQSWSNPLR